MNSMLWDGIETRPTISARIGDSILIGLIALGVLPGRVLSRISSSVVMSLVAFAVLTRRIRKAGKPVKIQAVRELPRFDETRSASIVTPSGTTGSDKKFEFGWKPTYPVGSENRGTRGLLIRPMRLVRSIMSAGF